MGIEPRASVQGGHELEDADLARLHVHLHLGEHGGPRGGRLPRGMERDGRDGGGRGEGVRRQGGVADRAPVGSADLAVLGDDVSHLHPEPARSRRDEQGADEEGRLLHGLSREIQGRGGGAGIEGRRVGVARRGHDLIRRHPQGLRGRGHERRLRARARRRRPHEQVERAVLAHPQGRGPALPHDGMTREGHSHPAPARARAAPGLPAAAPADLVRPGRHGLRRRHRGGRSRHPERRRHSGRVLGGGEVSEPELQRVFFEGVRDLVQLGLQGEERGQRSLAAQGGGAVGEGGVAGVEAKPQPREGRVHHDLVTIVDS